MIKDTSLALLRTFVRIVERGSLSAAAKDMGTTQPTVSRQLKDLETAYNATLLIRTTRSLHVTPAGRMVYEQARQTLQADELLREQLLGEVAEPTGRIQIAAPSGFGAFVIAPFCSGFVERHPKVTLDLRPTDRHVDLISEGIDVAIRIGRLDASSLYAQSLANLAEVIVIHPRLLSGEVKRPADLHGLPWAAFSGLREGSELRLRRRGSVQKIRLKPRLVTDQIVAYREALLAGAGAGVIHRYAVDSDIGEKRLIQLLPNWKLPEWPMHIVFPVKSPPNRVRIWCAELRLALAHISGLVLQ